MVLRAAGLLLWIATLGSVQGQQRVEAGFVPMADGVQLYYEKMGAGGPVVLVPGGLFIGRDFDRLADGRTVITYHMRNRGRSDSVRDTATLTIAQDVRDLEQVRAYFGADRVQLIGYSYLGLMVMLYAREHPERVDRIVQLGPVPLRYSSVYPEGWGVYPPAQLADSGAARTARSMRESRLHYQRPREYCELAWEVSRYGLVGDPSRVDRLGPGLCHLPNEWPTVLERHFGSHFRSVQALDLAWSDFRHVRMPVLTIHGDRDRNAPVGGGREWAQRLPQARLLLVPGAAHRSWVDAPELVLSVVDRFLDGSWPDGPQREVP